MAVRVAVATALVAMASVAPASAASIWTPVNTGTSETISAVQYPNANEIVFSTSLGHIYHGGAAGPFAQATLNVGNPIGFTDLAMSPDGTRGVAVGPSGIIYQSADSGATWTKVTGTQEYAGYCGNGTPTLSALADDLLSVQFADNTTAYITGKNRDVLKSTDGGATFTEVNKSPNGGTNIACQASPSDDFTDSQWLDPNTGYLISRYFGDYFLTTSGFSTSLGSRKGEATNSYQGPDELALDKADPTHAWAVNGDANVGTLGFQSTVDGGTTWAPVNYDGHQVALRDISASGLTVVAAGDGGDIYTSPDGKNFYRQISANLPTTNWQTVAVLDSSHAVVAGAHGSMLITGAANQTPDTTAPTGTIGGPTRLTTGQFGAYTVSAADNAGGSGLDTSSYVWSTPGLPSQSGHPAASFAFSTTGVHTIAVTFKDLAGNQGSATINVGVTTPTQGPGGSGPVSRTTGGVTIVIYKVVIVRGRKGRFIPVPVSTKKALRKFVIRLLPAKGSKALASTTKTLGKSTKKTVHVNFPASVKPGHYRLVVSVFTTGRHSHRVGRSVMQVFLLI